MPASVILLPLKIPGETVAGEAQRAKVGYGLWLFGANLYGVVLLADGEGDALMGAYGAVLGSRLNAGLCHSLSGKEQGGEGE